MGRILIPYGTTEGQTGKIAEVMADLIRTHGHDAEAVDVKEAPGTIPGDCDGVIVGASIHMGKHDKRIVAYVEDNREALAQLPSAFFSVSLAAQGDLDEAEKYVEEFTAETGWRPDRVARFSGALLYTHYGFFKRHLMKKIVKDKPGNLGTDLSRDYVYTEWDAVRRFADDFVSSLDAARG